MNKNVNTWIEGNGTVRTVFRKLALWEYTTLEGSKRLLLETIGKSEDPTHPYLLRYAIGKLKMDIQWISLYLPLLVMCMPFWFTFKALVLSHFTLYLYVWIGIMLSIGLAFKMTYFNLYQEACRFIYLAADSLLRETKEEVPVAEVCQEVRLIEPPNFSPIDAVVMENPHDLKEMLSPEPEAIVLPETPETAGKGKIAIVLLHELIQNECARPNIYKGNVQNALAFYTHITGCQPKNLQGKVKYYKSREAINLSTPNIRATHKKYLEILLSHYAEIGDDALYNKAEDLQAFIENRNNWKK